MQSTNRVKDVVLPHLLCPVTQAPNADTKLIPCLHRMNRVAAETLYGTISNFKGGNCIICTAAVTAFQTESALKRLITFLYSPFIKDDQRVIEAFKCPFTKEPLQESSTLIPCGHLVNAASLDALKTA